MSSSPLTARARLIELQRNLSEQIRSEIDASIIDPAGSLPTWREKYDQGTKGPLTPISLDELAHKTEKQQIVYFGDYHTLRESQKGPLRIIERWIKSERKVVLATEAFHIDSQHILDRWSAGEIDEATLLRESQWESRWGFPRRNYSLQLEFFRKRGLPILALNSEPTIVGDTFAAREQITAMRLMESTKEYPDAIHAVIFGDLHVAPDHLPLKVSSLALDLKTAAPRQVTIFQNLDRVYWELAQQEMEQDVKAVQIGSDRYCLVNTTPLVKHQSYLNWQLNEVELEESIGLEQWPSISSSVMSDQVWMLIESICDFLGIATRGLDGFTVYTGRNLDLLDRLNRDHRLDQEQMDLISSQLEREESCYIPGYQIIVLGNLSTRHATEEATHHINFICCKDDGDAVNQHEHFYEISIREAIGYLGTKIIDHKRACLHKNDLETLASELKGHRLDPVLTSTRQTVRDALQYINSETRWLKSGGRRPTVQALSTRPPDAVIGTAHIIGYRLGESIYRALMDGRLKREQVRELISSPLRGVEKLSENTWFEWTRSCHSDSSSESSSRG